jgi:hypothetical protein
MHYNGIQSPENSTQVPSTAEGPPGDSSEPRSWQATPSGDVRGSAACDMKSGCQSKPKRTHRQRSLLLTRCRQGGTLCHRVRNATHTMHALPRGASLHRVPLSRQHDSPRSHGCERSRMQVATRIMLRCRHSATDSLTSSHLTSRGCPRPYGRSAVSLSANVCRRQPTLHTRYERLVLYRSAWPRPNGRATIHASKPDAHPWADMRPSDSRHDAWHSTCTSQK